ncbi:hypothetical protein ABMA27_002893 [Loxostege sticticalis]|uniref:RNA-directed DNA polymerase from mobile element jockey-like n=1 Tax=Loxostege sticticalis TaxID=481309 RepID=A0ABR3HV95_LOXSC
MDNFLNIYSSQLEKRKRSLVFGDFNIDLLKKDKYITDYVVEVKESGYEILNKINPDYCTRETSKTKTIIDHISTNINNHTFSLSIIESSLSDHKHLYLEVGKEAPRRNSKINYTAIDYDTLYNNVLKTIDKIENDYSSLENCIILNINNTQKDLNVLNEWLLHNLLTINTSKTSFMILSAKNKVIPDFPPLTINDVPIKRSSREKYLGLYIDDKLTWTPHIDHVRGKLTSLIGALHILSFGK